ncbi:MAG: MaoC family dehydratase N-terminal domain-containing protein [Proteobacteria bacterium]|nr:MaoC family dehydratase N-terminal domain-containing protein [Pseudomonadota bacterium]
MVDVTSIEALRQSVGKCQEACDPIALAPARHLAATFDRGDADLVEGGALPPGWHWLYFLDAPATALLGPDGRTVPQGFLPDTGLPRRMWASGSFVFHGALRLGGQARSTMTIADITQKQGRSGALVFITTQHLVHQDDRLVVEEQRNLVFREAEQPGETPRHDEAPRDGTWQRTVMPDPVLLFRFSALTFNAHRIHYDSTYCREVEGYPGLVVHGPMLALLMLDLLGRECPGRAVRRFDYRAASPLFAGEPFTVAGRESAEGAAELWVAGSRGQLATAATATFA